MAETVVAIYGKTFPIKERLKGLGFRFRHTSGGTLRSASTNAVLDAGFGHDVPIWVIETGDPYGTLQQAGSLDGLKARIDGEEFDTGYEPPPAPPRQTGYDGFAFDTDDHLFGGAPMHGIR